MTTITAINNKPLPKVHQQNKAGFCRFENSYDSSDKFYASNSSKGEFLKAFLDKKLSDSGIELPANWVIEVKTAKDLNISEQAKFKEIVFAKYQGFLSSFFDLLERNEHDFKKDLDNIKMSECDKKVMEKIYNFSRDYYKVELKIPEIETPINLADLKDVNLCALEERAGGKEKQLFRKLMSLAPEVKRASDRFSVLEFKRQALFDAGKDSRDVITRILSIMAGLFVFDTFANPKLVEGATKLWGAKTGEIFEKTTGFLASTADDTTGGYKDYKQDQVVLGDEKAKKVFGVSIVAGALSSLGVFALNLANPLHGAVYALCTSGSSVVSNILTVKLMYDNYDNMVKDGIIKDKLPKDKNTLNYKWEKFKHVWNNYSQYDAYWGKLVGIAASIPIAMLASKTKLLAHKNKFIKAPALALVGSCGTIISMIYQIRGDKIKQAKINRQKEIMVNYS